MTSIKKNVVNYPNRLDKHKKNTNTNINVLQVNEKFHIIIRKGI